MKRRAANPWAGIDAALDAWTEQRREIDARLTALLGLPVMRDGGGRGEAGGGAGDSAGGRTMSRAPEGPVPVSSEGVEILSPATTSDLAREVERDGQLVDALERRVGFTDEAWRTWRVSTLEHCATHYLEARAAGDADLKTRAVANLRRVLRLGAKGGA